MSSSDKWASTTTNLVSKEQLKGNRYHLWKHLLAKNGLRADCAKWWTVEEQALEVTLWEQADAEYEKEKAALSAKIDALSKADQDVYFAEIGVEKPAAVDEWLNIKG